MNKLIGAQYYTIRDFCQTLEDFRESCRKVREIGYKVVQLSGIGDFEGKDIKAVLDEFGLTCACTHRPPQNYLENIEKEIEFHKPDKGLVVSMEDGIAIYMEDITYVSGNIKVTGC